jgi:hypothetical protein
LRARSCRILLRLFRRKIWKLTVRRVEVSSGTGLTLVGIGS